MINSLAACLELIQPLPTYDFTCKCLNAAPPWFWTKPASSSGKYHLPDERGVGGLVLHTKRVFRVAALLCESQKELDPAIVLPACLLHDIGRYGIIREEEHSQDDHPELGFNFLFAKGQEAVVPLPNKLVIQQVAIYYAVRTHMGRWGELPPTTPEEWAVHYADAIAANYIP